MIQYTTNQYIATGLLYKIPNICLQSQLNMDIKTECICFVRTFKVAFSKTNSYVVILFIRGVYLIVFNVLSRPSPASPRITPPGASDRSVCQPHKCNLHHHRKQRIRLSVCNT